MKPGSRISDRVSDQLLAICCRNTARAAIPHILSVLFTFLLLSDKVSAPLLQFWALLSCTLILVRVVLLRVIRQSSRMDHFTKRVYATILTLMLGCSFASVLFFFSSVDLFERAMLTAIMLGVSSASYTINIGYPPLLLSYIAPLLGTSCLLWATNASSDTNPGMSLAVSASILILSITLVRNGRFMFEAFSLTIESSTKIEEQSRRLSDALHHAEVAKRAAETSSQSKTRFIAAASHDLRQPVHVLNLFSGALRNAPLDTRTREIVENMNIAVTSLSSQLNSLLDISKLDSGSVTPNFRAVDLHRLSETLMGEMRKLAEDKRIDLINEVPQSVYIRTDPVMLSQVVRNLCGNAIKYTQTGSVRITATEDAHDIVLSIIDTGIGIDVSENDKVFEEFYQVANRTRDREKGLGLGLSIVERLVKILNHNLTLESSVGKGTTVRISLQKCNENDVQQKGTEVVSHSPSCLPTGFWVHLVDDETAVQNSVKAFLATVGAKVTTSDSSATAIQFLATQRPDAVLVDLRLRDGDSGLAVVDSIKDPSLPIALITGEAVDGSSLTTDYPDLLMLQKPVSDEALLELLEYMTVSEM